MGLVWRCIVGALRHDRITAPIVLDNLGSHKGKTVRQAIRKADAHLLFLPPYSPDLDPIEQMLSKLKTLLREAVERSVDAT